MKLSVCTISPPNYIHSAAFSEVAETLIWAARSLGHDVVETTRTDLPGRRTIVLGANLLRHHPQRIGPDTILYNLEQVQPGQWLDGGMMDLFRRCSLWDYSARNALELERLGLARPRVVPIGWAPVLRRIERSEEDIDVLFYGSLNERRCAVLEQLKNDGIQVRSLFGVYGKERDRFIARSRIVLNLHYYEARVFEIVRVSYLLANGRAVVSERGSAAEEEAPFEQGVAFADYPDLVATCRQLLANPGERVALATRGQQLMESRRALDSMRDALDDVRVAEPLVVGSADNATDSAAAAPQKLLPLYYEWDRPEVVARVKARGKVILDVGCAAGAMGRAMLAKGAREVVGVEVVLDAVDIARTRLTAAHRFDLNELPTLPYPDGYFDIFTFADVLEHLAYPDAVLCHLKRWLKPGGEIVCSIPNVRHESVLLPLLVNGSWDYQDEGILDRTHLRFYTLDSLMKLVRDAGFTLHPEIQAVTSPPSSHLDQVSALVGALGGDAARFRKEATAIQYLLTATLPA